MHASVKFAAVAVFAALAGCGKSPPTCSSDNVLELLADIHRDKMRGNIIDVSTLDIDSAKYKFNEIITLEKTENSSSCRASTNVTIKRKNGQGQVDEKNPANVTIETNYTAWITDDGKNVVVEASKM